MFVIFFFNVISKLIKFDLNNLMKLDVLQFIEKNHSSFELIKNKFIENKNMFQILSQEIRNIEPNMLFTDQEISEDYRQKKSDLKLDDHLYAVYSTKIYHIL